ncbi:hypothetical protein NC796_17320 [Aliifodinibius sp. S!AR15-10]|uniref:hypothetical protein n=1 Tax=Aliifodinibius sp. S!AR15-10 TaxID=2950437 RepID=UPI0028636BB8|nr:hypothetical protein [Aliifodinibius sp. S!AR15-10]MDR8392920.1 hypothetical protein [Aliifodinibius sp. S!AR15-10]
MSIVELKMFEYYSTGKYKGFLLKKTEVIDKQKSLKRLIFTNGQFEVSAIGRFQEEALQTIFSQIDRYLEHNPVHSHAV